MSKGADRRPGGFRGFPGRTLLGDRRHPPRLAEQPERDREVDEVPEDAVEKRGVVRAGQSKIAPDSQPPIAMPMIVAMSTMPIRVPASAAGDSRTMMA